ncbi:MAG TPA: glycosyltransferase [Methanomicrobia archaeon]|nr:glycosyltransferase [Methanomicrobia archaeon]
MIIKTRQYVHRVIVVDDGSDDATADIAKAVDAIVYKLPKNMGKSCALYKGFQLAGDECQYVVILDGDAQHNPDEIPRLLDPLLHEKADMVIGSRFLGTDSEHDIPLYRQVGQRILNVATNVGANTSITDSQSGFRAINMEKLRTVKCNSKDYNIESDMIHAFAQKGYRICEVPISVRYNIPFKHKKPPFAHGFGVLLGILNKIVYHKPLLFFGILSVGAGIGFIASISYVIHIYRTAGELLIGFSLVSMVLLLMAFMSFNTGVMMNYLLNYIDLRRKENAEDSDE